MRSRSVFKSFRFEIVLYSILSLLYTVVTEALLYCFLYYFKIFIKGLVKASEQDIGLGQAVEGLLNMPITNGTSFIDGTSTTGLTHSLTSLLTINRDYMVATMIIAFIIGMILFVIYFLFLTRRFSRYLYEISDGIKVIAGGNFDARIRVKNEDEFAVIANSVNKMAGDIRQMIENEHKSEQLKHELITNVAHDLRTPLTSIIGYLDLAKEPGLEEQEKERYVAIAYEKSKRLESLIEDLFSYTKFSSGDVAVHKEKLNIVKLLEQMMDEFYPSLQEESLEYHFVSNVSNVYILADGNLLARAFANLIGNAIKYGKNGKQIHIELTAYQKEVKISVINYGNVIPEKDLPYIFDKFYRVESSRSMDTGGTGLGLAIAKKIILLHDGELMAKSDMEGTEFITTLPMEGVTKENERKRE